MENLRILQNKIRRGRIVGWIFVAAYGLLAAGLLAVGETANGVFVVFIALGWLIAAAAAQFGAWSVAKPIYSIVGIIAFPVGLVMFSLGRAMCVAGQELDSAGGIRAIRGVERAQSIYKDEQPARRQLVERMSKEGFDDVADEVFRVSWGSERCPTCNNAQRKYVHLPITYCPLCD